MAYFHSHCQIVMVGRSALLHVAIQIQPLLPCSSILQVLGNLSILCVDGEKMEDGEWVGSFLIGWVWKTHVTSPSSHWLPLSVVKGSAGNTVGLCAQEEEEMGLVSS